MPARLANLRTPAMLAAIVREYQSRRAISLIAADLRASRRTVYRLLHEAGVAVRRKERPPVPRRWCERCQRYHRVSQ